jgi:hypothetical protein
MIISDLNHIEVVSEETETHIVGGFLFIYSHIFSNLGAKGQTTSTSTFTRTITPPGYRGSSSTSSSTTVSYW